MKRTVVTFFPHNPIPPQSGAHRRCLEVLTALRALDCETTLVSSELTSYPPWRPDSVRQLEREYGALVRLHRPGLRDYLVAGACFLYYRLSGRRMPVDSRAHAPPGLCRLFDAVLDDVAPDIVLINYSCFDRLLDHVRHRDPLRVIDTYDLWSLNVAMKQALARQVGHRPASLDAIPDRVLDERFYDRQALAPSAEEFRIVDRYDCTLAITRSEADLIGRHAPHTRVVHVPMTLPVAEAGNSYDGPPLFVAGPNPFNLQGYCYFVRKVLPRLRERVPSFRLTVAGPYCAYLPPTDGVSLAGFVPDLGAAYAKARFAICPVFGGTGQQIKIVEAMAHGVPVVALRAPAEQSPIRHGVNGLVAEDAAQFAAHCAVLWNDRELCASLGRAAREAVGHDLSPALLRRLLADVLATRRRRRVGFDTRCP
ncbi:MAG TPA: glycosyltransferase [Gemmataceae bacterium]|nr:glycosyltransferase [Gemmataceae bacterium]